MTAAAPATDRLAELVAHLSGRSDSVAQVALDTSGDPETRRNDPLAAVASALVAIRRDEVPALASTSH